LDQIGAGKDKLEQKTIDFEKLEESGLKEGKWDAVYITFVTAFNAVRSGDFMLTVSMQTRHNQVCRRWSCCLRED
jgi:hypothetical protein